MSCALLYISLLSIEMSPLVHTLKQAVCHLNRANQLILDAIHGAILAGITQLAD